MGILPLIMDYSQQKKMQKDSLLIGRFLKAIFFFLCLMHLVSCAEKVIEPPADLIAKDKMIDILYDLALLNSANSTNPDALKKNSVETMPYLFEKYDIDSVQFSQSDLYYASVPLEYESIYETIQSRLEKEIQVFDEERQQKTEKAREKAAKVRDSLKKLAKTGPPPVLVRKESNNEE